MNKKPSLIILYIIISAIIFYKIRQPHIVSYAEEIKPLWEYECVDTMKTSRDKASEWKSSRNLKAHIENQMDAVVEMGGNCVAIATPYDEEFLPYLKEWVSAARNRNLHIWFRGNFSSWEGWFNYPKGMTTAQHNELTRKFIIDHAFLFEDGDIFTPSPEAENGGPFNQVEKDEHETFRKYLIAEYDTAKDAFAQIDKDVRVNWLAMNGGLAVRMFDQPTINALGRVAAIDHYIKTPPEMGSFIRYFYEKFGAKVVIGEWGAPIPQINGDMTEDEQAAFIGDLLQEMYIYNEMVEGISYWVLYDGSTSLQNPDETPRKAFETIKKYYRPGAVNGYIKDNYGKALADAELSVDGVKRYKTDANGYYEFSLPAGYHKILMTHSSADSREINFGVDSDEVISRQIALNSHDTKTWHWVRSVFAKIRNLLSFD